ncbi:MAG: hypothetical protein CK548_01625 [Opitutia bacterium]|nr:MAG: hypothetical protein CK548_01625 [Opitutae bacterium]
MVPSAVVAAIKKRGLFGYPVPAAVTHEDSARLVRPAAFPSSRRSSCGSRTPQPLIEISSRA